MESITGIDILIFLGFGLGLLIVSILAVLLEDSDETIGRLPFLGWLLAFIFLPAIASAIAGIFTSEVGRLFVSLAGTLALTYPVLQRYVQRARDAGMGKTIAFLSIVPVVSFVTSLILLFAPGATVRAHSEGPAVFSNAT